MFLYNSGILGSLQLKQINELSGEATATCAEGGLSVNFVKGEASGTGVLTSAPVRSGAECCEEPSSVGRRTVTNRGSSGNSHFKQSLLLAGQSSNSLW